MPFEQSLENGLLLRTARDEKDIQAYVDFNTVYNNPAEGRNTNILMRYLPGSSLEDYQLVEDTRSGQIAATTCLIPWEMQFGGIPLRAAQLEQVLSHPDYRRHGLVKIQMKRFMQVVAERKADLSFIWGIPYYYRQYGYSYAIEGNTFESLPSWRIPEAADPATASPFRLRSAVVEDAPALTELYRQAMAHTAFHITRGLDHWRYLLQHARFPVEILEDVRTNQPIGYIGCVQSPAAGSVQIVESGITSVEHAWAVLRALKARTHGEIQIAWPRTGSLASLAASLGSLTLIGGQWLFHITDPANFMRKIAPVLESRLAASDCAGISQDLVINLFRQAYRLRFETGRLSTVDALGFVDSSMGADGGDLCIPPDAFVRLLLGYRGLDALLDAWPDIVLKPQARPLVEALFPRTNSYLYATYAYFG